MDGTTFDFPEKLAERLAKEKSLPEDVRRTLADVSNRTTDNIRELFPDTALQNHIEKTVKDIYQTEDFFLSLEPHPWIVKTILDLEKIYHNGFLSKPSHAHSGSHTGKAKTIAHYFGKHFEKNRLVLTGNKTLVHWHILIDDTFDVQHNEDTPWHSPSRQFILMDQPKNQHITWVPRLFLEKQEEWWSAIANVLVNEYK